MSRPVSRTAKSSGERVNSRTKRWIWPVVIGLAAAALGSGSPAGADADRSGLPEAIDTILGDSRMEGGAASVVVADAASGDVLYQHRPTERLMPASNTKLPTSAAAMEILGPDHRFTTDVLTNGRRQGSVLRGDLYLRGSGDPTALAKDYDKLAADLAGSGVTRVDGRLLADDTRFDSARLGRSWAADDESAYYSAQISALSVAPDTDYDTGTVIVEVAPGTEAGDEPTVTVTPKTDYVDLDVRATTVAAGGSNDLTVEREHGTNTIVVSGTTPVGGSGATEWVSVWEPTGYAAAVFRDALAAHGVKVTGPTRLGRATPAGARQLASHASMPLKDLLIPFMKLSNNMHAEILTKAMGRKVSGEGTWSAGLAAVSGYAKGVGVDTGKLRQVDGSGLSRMNNFTAGQFTELLLAVRAEPWYADWYKSLPVACGPDRFVGGTLRTRMCGTPAALNARAKTGSLTGASALSGYVTDAGGRELVYSIVLNNYLASSVKPLEDAIVVTLARSTADEAVPVKPGGAARAAERNGDLECSWRKPGEC
ncbi:D-alanyl-D-alanine carboxypeptidase/D-alanyl-D-alanine-endopeptidase (penicillin-binding protein 4) [Streptomyces phaeochromogenes]|jgi:serine-type D-Ala-D-Ala carboxypeptidase/endopeptidase (penicillin-binding protein 4)|uniref:D-alanyl-D-alanine carboxypeptidase/D-alanyl-D-alanine endopeptidase n=1 Tax=Streptomyces TaxID=1883 RepID=UPI00117F9ECA|nr:D-alanyl-D-alanine carboxypeptidase/D-alanyl-D-alanine-endopeptidase (penicillin-binding protein 4) [Streptomyces phaeochromogenes]TRO69890.1 D-alanyl-D-alanine carboxypeptidase/D-alanyl-D-alanine-endopeptidase [Streptomyces sp. IB201691-2A2]